MNHWGGRDSATVADMVSGGGVGVRSRPHCARMSINIAERTFLKSVSSVTLGKPAHSVGLLSAAYRKLLLSRATLHLESHHVGER